MTTRLEGRIEHLTAQMSKLAGKIEAAPDDPRTEGWKARWFECQRSLANIRDAGQETLGEAAARIEVDVPTAPFAVKGD